MSQQYEEMTTEQLEAIVTVSEDKDTLKEIADFLNTSYGNAISVDKLKDKILEALKPVENVDPKTPKTAEELNAEYLKMDRTKITDPMLLRKVIRAQELALVRCHVHPNNPVEMQVPTKYFNIGNAYVKTGIVVPFGAENEHGVHIPKILYNHLKSQTYVVVKETRDEKGRPKFIPTTRPSYTINVLEPYTKEQLAEFAKKQAALAIA